MRVVFLFARVGLSWYISLRWCWAAIHLLKKDPDAIMVILPADHIITPASKLKKTIKQAIQAVKKHNRLVTIGIQPTSPHTGYGYIESQQKDPIHYNVTKFHEKPSPQKADTYLKQGNFFWNSGIFIWKAKTILEMFQTHLPRHYDILSTIQSLDRTQTYKNALSHLFSQFDNISIDYGILEKCAPQMMMVKAEFSWNDVGHLSSLDAVWPKDNQNNAKKANTLTINSTHNIIHSTKRLITTIDIHNLIIIDTDDALLIMPKSNTTDLPNLYNELPEKYK